MIKIKDLCIGYHGRSIKLPGITGWFKRGSMTAVLGSNGIGKSTFLRTLAGFLPPSSGELKFSMDEVIKIGYLPQKVYVNYRFPLTVFDFVAIGLWPKTGLLKRIDEQKNTVVLQALQCMKLDTVLRENISILSVGQFQCMLFARLLVQRASLILLDEPFNSVDNETCDLMLSVLGKLNNSGSTIVVVLHNNKIITEYFSHALFLSKTVHIWRYYV